MSAALVPTAPVESEEKPLPIVGEWYWIEFAPRAGQDDEEPYLGLRCCKALGSNHAKFSRCWEHGTSVDRVLYSDSHRWTHEPKWKEHFQQQIDETQAKLKEAIAALAGDFATAKVLPQFGSSQPSTALVANSVPVETQKSQLLDLKNVGLPELQKSVKALTLEMVIAHKHLFLPELLQAERFQDAGDAIEQKLFALELYAGFGESVCMIQDGKPAEPMEPIRIHQMLRYMDEETLISALEGGMNFEDLAAFDDWACTNIDAITPYPRAVVAWRVRRFRKNYGAIPDLRTAFQHLAWHDADEQTYLLIRNGQKIFRACTALSFEPRMIPFRNEFVGEFKTEKKWYSDPPSQVVTPAHVEYDDRVEERSKEVRHYNRIIFLIQGLLDRSEVFTPHPPVDLSSEQGADWLVPVRDEEDGLPTSAPVEFAGYRDACNKPLQKGDTVYACFEHTERARSYRDKDRTWELRALFRFEGYAEGKTKIRLSKGGNTRHGFQFPKHPWNRGEWGEWPAPRSHYTCEPSEIFRLASYTPGDYKIFLADARTRARYLQWAPQLVRAERWHREGKPELPA